MKNLVMKSTTLFFVCLCFTLAQLVQAECKPCTNKVKEEKKETVVQRIKNKLSEITGKNKTSKQPEKTTEKTGSQHCTPCTETEQCPENCTKENKDVTVEVIVQSDDGTIIDASDVAVIVAEIIEAEMESSDDSDDDLDDEFYDEENDDEYDDNFVIFEEDDTDF